jgi:hypothetical protein
MLQIPHTVQHTLGSPHLVVSCSATICAAAGFLCGWAVHVFCCGLIRASALWSLSLWLVVAPDKKPCPSLYRHCSQVNVCLEL